MEKRGHFNFALTSTRRVFTEQTGTDSWQYEAIHTLHKVIVEIYPDTQPIAKKVNLREWFKKFVELRNKTRGHGAITPDTCAKCVPQLKESIQLLIDNNPLFQLPWAYLHRNLSGKYRVVELGEDTSAFSELKTAKASHEEHFQDGVYLWIDRPRLVSHLHSNLNLNDFFVPNGGFKKNHYELHSPISDNRRNVDAGQFLNEPSDRPPSETEGEKVLDGIGNVFTNLPAPPSGFVKRPILEKEVLDNVIDDRHPIVTLVGRGGIGKTSLALVILHQIAELSERYTVIIWFSARDIDLTESGPKVVQPKTLTEKEISNEYKRLITELEPSTSPDSMAQHMNMSPVGPTLFVFDNFETVRNPIDLYNWIDTNIRLPNKAVITSRFRDFKADYPIEVSGMEPNEAKELIRKTASKLNILDKVGTKETNQIVEQSDGHPYVIKIILGEMTDTRQFSKPSKVLARKDDILDALFERNYANLSPLASRIFLTLSGWRSLVPQLAVEAVLHWRNLEVNPEDAIEELIRMSLIERTSAQDDTDFIGVPITAALFGLKKLRVSQDRELIQDDIQFLQGFGTTVTTGLKMGSYPRIRSIFKKIALQINNESVSMIEARPMLEFIAKNYPQAWLLLADLEGEVNDEPEQEATYVRNFLEGHQHGKESHKAWIRLVSIYRKMENVIGSCGAFISASKITEPDINDVSSMANYVNSRPEIINEMNPDQRVALLTPLAELMETHLGSANATDLSRLAWLYLHSGQKEQARILASKGLQLPSEQDNIYCQRLLERLTKF